MAQQTDEHWMREAMAEAAVAMTEDELPIGCVIVCQNEIIGRGRRRLDGHVTLDHAEPQAIRQAMSPNRRHGRECVLYSTLEPCLMCFAAIAHSRINRVVYGLDDPSGGGTKVNVRGILRYADEAPVVEKGILEPEIRAMMKKYFQTTKHPYWSAHPNHVLVKFCLE